MAISALKPSVSTWGGFMPEMPLWGAGLLGPTKSRLGSNLPVLGLKLDRTGAYLLGPNFNLRRTWASWLQLALKGSQLGPTWAQSAVGVGPKGIQMDSKLKPCDAHERQGHVLTCRNLASGDSFTPSWAQRRHTLGIIASNEESSIAKRRGNYQ